MDGFLLYIIAFLLSLFANILSQIAGGGTSLIVIPSLIFLGIDPRIAISSIKVSSLGGITALPPYIRSNKIVWTFMPALIVASVLSAFAGSWLLLSLDSEQVERIFGIIILLLLPLIVIKKKWGLTHDVERSKIVQYIGLFVYFIIAVAQAAFGAGLGMIATYILVTFFGYSLIHANATRRVVLVLQNGLTFVILLVAGIVNIWLGGALLLGSIIGNNLGAKLAIYKGNGFVKILFVILIVISGITLLL